MKTYKEIFERDVRLLKNIIKDFDINDSTFDKFYSEYLDPDGYYINSDGYKKRNDVECTADAIISVKRLYDHEGFDENFVNRFMFMREVPFIFFPRERGGINTSRYSMFGDRIDCTLFDLKQYFENKPCRLFKAYQRPKTQKWLQSFNNDFAELVKWLKIESIFVDEYNNVYDLEYEDDRIITSYRNQYKRNWSNRYYKNVKKKIEMCKLSGRFTDCQ